MDRICEALVLAVHYLGEERNDEEHTEDDDVRVVEDVAGILADASDEEKAALIRVSRALGHPGWATHLGID